MKKFTVILSFILMISILVVPMNVLAAEYKDFKEVKRTSNGIYGVIVVKETSWTDDTASSSGVGIQQIYTVTKVNSGGYVYIEFKEENNVKIREVTPGSSFTIVGDGVRTSTGVQYLFKLKSGTSISTTTELATVTADILVNDASLGCNLSFSPLSAKCLELNGKYYDDNGKEVTETEYNKACSNYVPDEIPSDEPNPETGSVIPYIAVGGGLLAIAGVYLYSRKSSKFYKI